MNLAAYQRALLHLSFVEQAGEADFAAFGDRTRFYMYRQMIRSRLLGMAKQAFRATLEVVGSEAFEASFERYLGRRPPRSPLIREVIADFAPFVITDAALLERGPSCTADLVRFEEAKWRVAYRQRFPADELRDFDFAGVPALNPALELLSLQHRVHEWVEAKRPGACAAEPCRLLVYRPPQHDDLRWYVPDPLTFRLLEEARTERDRPLSDLVRKAAQSLGRDLDEALLEELANGVTLALERGVLLGSREQIASSVGSGTQP
jgi:hypothetical protein